MKAKNRKKYRAVTAALSVAAVGLLALGSVTGARAALTSISEDYISEFGTQHIGVSLVEQTGDHDAQTIADDGELLVNLVGKDEPFVIGKKYDEKLMAQNTGAIDEYVRMTVRKYWTDDSGKRVNLSPGLIKLSFNESDWIKVDENPDDEIIVLYYKKPLAAGEGSGAGEMTKEALETLRVDNEILKWVEQSTEGNVITTTYAYSGISVGLDADVDAVQTHNAHDAILSAWGDDVTIDAASGAITGVN